MEPESMNRWMQRAGGYEEQAGVANDPSLDGSRARAAARSPGRHRDSHGVPSRDRAGPSFRTSRRARASAAFDAAPVRQGRGGASRDVDLPREIYSILRTKGPVNSARKIQMT